MNEIKARALGALMVAGSVVSAKMFIFDPIDNVHNHPSAIIHYSLKGVMLAPILLVVGLAYVIWGSKVTAYSRNRNNWGWKEYLILLVGFAPAILTMIWVDGQMHSF